MKNSIVVESHVRGLLSYLVTVSGAVYHTHRKLPVDDNRASAYSPSVTVAGFENCRELI